MRLHNLVLLSGPICSGKSSLASMLSKKFSFKIVNTTDFVRARAKNSGFDIKNRRDLQLYGQKLDKKHGGDWLVQDFAKLVKDTASHIIVDSVRTKDQIDAFRKAYGGAAHVHLNAPIEIRSNRYNMKYHGRDDELKNYEETQRNLTEKKVKFLDAFSDISIDTKRCNQIDVLERVASLLGLYGNSHDQLVDVLIGGQYGSEGKGNVASYLASEYDYLVRVGGPNAGHKVKLNHSEDYVFRQLPSGTAACNAKLVIGPGAVINVDVLLKEISDHNIGIQRLFIDPQAMVISEEDILCEKQSVMKDIASTASGTGMAAARRIVCRGADDIIFAKDIERLKPFIRPSIEVFETAFRDKNKVFLEGTQGTGLSIYHGYYPHVTSRDTTVSGCLAEAGISSVRVRKVIMVCRTYPIRVPFSVTGKTSGPMSEDISREEISKRSGLPLEEIAEITSVTGGKRRIGEFDWHLLRKATALNAPTDIALTFADYIDKKNREARRFEQLTEETVRFIEEIERFTKAPVSLISTRFHIRSIIDRRSW